MTARSELPKTGLTRRRFVRRLGVSALGWDVWRRRAAADATPQDTLTLDLPQLRACIFIFYYGGPSHLDTYDMKPDAPVEVRGEFEAIATNVPGLFICEHLPQMAALMDKVALVRSMHHTNRLHDSASIETFTGRQGPEGDREEFSPIRQHVPCHGAILNALCDPDIEIPHAVLPWLFHNVIDVPCQGGGFLGRKFDPLQITGNPQTLTFSASMLSYPQGLSFARIEQRRLLLDRFDDPVSDQMGEPLRRFYEQAYELMESEKLRAALQIEQETAATRKRYGLSESAPHGQAAALAHGRNLRGQSLLQARRLVEAGIPFVNVNDFRQQGQNWDAHSDNFGQHKEYLLPQADVGLSALIQDLDQRGLLESTLIVALGEFGRTPRINGNAGRDHWPDCYTILLAGGGVRGGAVYGESDAHGAFPERDPVTPADLAATIYWRFGLDPRYEIHDTAGRPYRLADGRPLIELFA